MDKEHTRGTTISFFFFVGNRICLFVCVYLLKVEFSLKTDSGYPQDTGVTLFTLATPENPLHYNTHWSAPPVSTLAHSRGPGARQAEVLSAPLATGVRLEFPRDFFRCFPLIPRELRVFRTIFPYFEIRCLPLDFFEI